MECANSPFVLIFARCALLKRALGRGAETDGRKAKQEQKGSELERIDTTVRSQFSIIKRRIKNIEREKTPKNLLWRPLMMMMILLLEPLKSYSFVLDGVLKSTCYFIHWIRKGWPECCRPPPPFRAILHPGRHKQRAGRLKALLYTHVAQSCIVLENPTISIYCGNGSMCPRLRAPRVS